VRADILVAGARVQLVHLLNARQLSISD